MMRNINWFLSVISVFFAMNLALAQDGVIDSGTYPDMLCPSYHRSGENTVFRAQADQFIALSCEETFHHPLQDKSGHIPPFRVPRMGRFGAGKPPGRNMQHHPAVDFHVGERETDVSVYAAHGGRMTTFRNAPKYRHYIAITKEITTGKGKCVGKIVTIYGHVDLDLDEAAGLRLNGKTVRKGDLLSRHLYSGTRGGPHLHFEVRYYRPTDKGDETFYGSRFPGGRSSGLTEKAVGPWPYGFWNPDVGYGFADPRNHGVKCY